MPLYQAIRKNGNIAKRNIFNFVLFSCRHYIGIPVDKEKLGTESRIQLNDCIKDVGYIIEFIEFEVNKISPKERKYFTTSLKVDANTNMGIVMDVKQELRKANALKINYSTRYSQDYIASK